MMTANMVEALEEGAFHDTRWVNELLHRFAEYYFDALSAYEKDPASAPAVWRRAFDSAQQPEVNALQNLILGVNAHINYDLVLTLVDMLEPEWRHLSVDKLEKRYADHCRVNDIIGGTIDAVQDQVIERAQPVMRFVDIALGPIDEWMTSRLIAHWREEVWNNALVLLQRDAGFERERGRIKVEAAALKRAQAILLEDGSGGMLTLV